MSKFLFQNNAAATLAVQLTAIGTTMSLGVGGGTVFPNPANNETFRLTLQVGSNLEIVECTARAGDVLTIVRGVENTTAQVWPVGTPVEMRVTAGIMQSFFQLFAETIDFAKTLALGTAGKITGGTIDSTTVVNSTITNPNLRTGSVKPVDGTTDHAIVMPNGGGMPTITGKNILTQAGDDAITGPLKTTGDVAGATGTFGSLSFKSGTTLLGGMLVDLTTGITLSNEADTDIVFKTLNIERIHFESTNHYLGIGTSTPGAAIHYEKLAAEALAIRVKNNAGQYDLGIAIDGTVSFSWGAFAYAMVQGGQVRWSMDTTGRVTSSGSTGFNGNATGVRYIGTSDPSGGSDGDIWLKV